MNAVIATGGKQYNVKEDDVIQVEKITGEIGDEIKLDQVLMVKDDKGVRFGKPFLDGEQVIGRIEKQEKGKKILIIKHKRRKGYRRKKGHRQLITSLRILSIGAAKN